MYFNSIAGSYNGSTAAFEAVNLGSIPSPAAVKCIEGPRGVNRLEIL